MFESDSEPMSLCLGAAVAIARVVSEIFRTAVVIYELVAAVKERVDGEYAQGRNTVMGDEELEQMVFDAAPEFFDELMAHKRVL